MKRHQSHKKSGLEVAYIGNYNGPIPDNIDLVETEHDYVKTCRAISDNRSFVRIWVRHKSHSVWLCNFAEQIGIECQYSELTPLSILADRWNVTLPPWVTDEMVQSEALLDISVSGINADRFEDIVLSYFIDPVFVLKKLTEDNLSIIITSLTNSKTTALFEKHPIIQRCFDEKVTEWLSGSKLPWVQYICEHLKDDLEKLWKDLTLWRLLAGYPKRLLEFVVSTQSILSLPKIPLRALENMPLHRVAVEQATTQIELFFKEVIPTIETSDGLSKLIEYVSGVLSKEFQILTSLFSDERFSITPEMIELLQQKFNSCPGISSFQLSSLNRFIKPPLPNLPAEDVDWGSEQWMKWIIDEYIPYRHWQTLNQKSESGLEEVVGRFSDWYIREYDHLHQDESKSLVHLLHQWKDSINNDSVSLILLVDSLPLTFWKLFNDELVKAGFHMYSKNYCFAPLPSNTENSKPLLLSGEWTASGSKYESMLKERAQHDWQGKNVIYRPNLKSLSEVKLPDDPTVILLNYLSADELLHSDVELRNSTYEDELHRLFARLAETLRNLFDRWEGEREKFGLYVVSDHGTSRVLDEEKKSFESKTITKLFSNEKHRYAVLEKHEVEKIPINLWDLGYKFSRSFCNDRRVFFIPRGHNTVKVQNLGNGYIHGGASPEEILVPAAIYRPVKAIWKKIASRFLNLKMDRQSGKAEFYILRVTPIEIEIQNPNNESVNVSRVEVLCPNVDVKNYTTSEIPGGGRTKFSIELYFEKSAVDQDELILQFTYNIAGEEQVAELRSDAEFKSAQGNRLSLKDL